MAHKLDLGIVSEGVESIAQKEFLRARGCDAAQGHYISRPAPAAVIAEWMANQSPPPRTRSARGGRKKVVRMR